MVESTYPAYHLEPRPVSDHLDDYSVHYDDEHPNNEERPVAPDSTGSKDSLEEAAGKNHKPGLFARFNPFMHSNARRDEKKDEAARLDAIQAQIDELMLREHRTEHRMLDTPPTPPARARSQQSGPSRSRRDDLDAKISSKHFFEQGYFGPRGGTKLVSVAEDPAEDENDDEKYEWRCVTARNDDQKDGWQRVRKQPPHPDLPLAGKGKGPSTRPRGYDYTSASLAQQAVRGIPPAPGAERSLRKVRGNRELKQAHDSAIYIPRPSPNSSDRQLRQPHDSGVYVPRKSHNTSDRSYDPNHGRQPIETRLERRDRIEREDLSRQASNSSPPRPSPDPVRGENGRILWPLQEPPGGYGGFYGYIDKLEKLKHGPRMVDGVRQPRRPTDKINGMGRLCRQASSPDMKGGPQYYMYNGPGTLPTPYYLHDKNNPDPRWVNVPQPQKIRVKKPVRQIKSVSALDREPLRKNQAEVEGIYEARQRSRRDLLEGKQSEPLSLAARRKGFFESERFEPVRAHVPVSRREFLEGERSEPLRVSARTRAHKPAHGMAEFVSEFRMTGYMPAYSMPEQKPAYKTPVDMLTHLPPTPTNDPSDHSPDIGPKSLRGKRSSSSFSASSFHSDVDRRNRTVLVPNTKGRLRTANGLSSQASVSSFGQKSTKSFQTAKAQISMPALRVRHRQSFVDLRGGDMRNHDADVQGQMLKMPPPVKLGAQVDRNGSVQSKDYGQIGAGYSGMISSLQRYPSSSQASAPPAQQKPQPMTSQKPGERYIMSGGLGSASAKSRSRGVSISTVPERSIKKLDVQSAVCVDVASESGDTGSGAESGYRSGDFRSRFMPKYAELEGEGPGYIHHYDDDELIGIGH